MKKTQIVLLIWLLTLLSPDLVSADYYRYVDENGTPHYVDSMSKVPEEYQDRVVREVVPKAEETLPEDVVPDTNAQIPDEAKEALNKPNVLERREKAKQEAEEKKRQEALLEEKKKLDEEYAALMKERDEITASKEEWSKRYKTRKRKGMTRKKLKELDIMELEWEEKYKAWEIKKSALDKQMQ